MRPWHSFRVRIALLATALPGLVLVGFGYYAWLAVQRISLERVDGEIRSIARRHLGPPMDAAAWQRADEALHSFYDDPEGTAVVLLIKDGGGGEVFRSAAFPAGYGLERLPTPDQHLAPMPLNAWDSVAPQPPPGPRADPGAMPGDAPPRHDAPSEPGPPEDRPGPPGGRGPGPGPGPRNGRPPEPGMHRPHPAPGMPPPPQGAPHFAPVPPPQGLDHGAVPPPPRDGAMALAQADPAPGRPAGPPPREPLPGGAFGPGPGHGPGRGLGPGRGMRGPGPRMPEPVLHGFDAWSEGGTAWRIGVLSSPHTTIALGLDMARFAADAQRLRNALLFGLPVGLLLVGVAGFVLAGRALRPVNVLTRHAERINAQDLSQRIPLHGETEEFQRLINVFNAMLERLDSSFKQAMRFSADAAHELNTPLTVLQGELERGVQEAEAASPEQERCARLLAEVQRLKAITRKLLLLAQADAGRLAIRRRPFDLSAALAAMAEDLEALHPGYRVRTRIEPGIRIDADPDLLPQTIHNLMANAVKYNEPGGRIDVVLKTKPGEAKLTISNSGAGIPPEDRPRVFERFYRSDAARNRSTGGAGLGLSLAREIARAHGGDLCLEDTPPGLTAFSCRLPLAPPQ